MTITQKIWWGHFFSRIKSSVKSASKFIFVINFSNTIAMIAIMSPVLLNIAWLMNSNINNPVILSAIIVTLPRQVNALFNIYGVLCNIMQWNSSYYPKLRSLVSSTDSSFVERSDFSNRIKIHEISVFNDNQQVLLESLNQLLTYISSIKSGGLLFLVLMVQGKVHYCVF